MLLCVQASQASIICYATLCTSKPCYVTFQCISKPSYVNQHKLVAVVWRLHCKCVVSAVAGVQSVVRSVITVATM